MSEIARRQVVLLKNRTYSAFLFDMDGTLIDSLGSSRRCWSRWAGKHGVDFEPMWREMHGMRQADAMRRWGPSGLDIAEEVKALVAAEMEDCEDVGPIQGAARFLNELPQDRWCVVTSAPKRLAQRRLQVAGLPTPVNMVAAEDVDDGKPAPDCYLQAARSLGFAAADCLAWEDAPAGIAAAEAAGMDVIVLSATHSGEFVTPNFMIQNYDELRVTAGPTGELQLSLTKR
jgi:sugar-phosphatase